MFGWNLHVERAYLGISVAGGNNSQWRPPTFVTFWKHLVGHYVRQDTELDGPSLVWSNRAYLMSDGTQSIYNAKTSTMLSMGLANAWIGDCLGTSCYVILSRNEERWVANTISNRSFPFQADMNPQYHTFTTTYYWFLEFMFPGIS